jgi:hypothetical protein
MSIEHETNKTEVQFPLANEQDRGSILLANEQDRGSIPLANAKRQIEQET